MIREIVLKVFPFMACIDGIFMVVNPSKAAVKLYKLDEREIKKPTIDLVQANGSSAMSLGILGILLSYGIVETNTAVSISVVPRMAFMLFSIMTGSEVGCGLTKAKNLAKIVFATLLIEGRWMDPIVPLKVRGGLYILVGLVTTFVPEKIAKEVEITASASKLRCLRARGKTDTIYGTLILALATTTYNQALGMSYLAWFLCSVYSDFIVGDKIRSDAVVQLMISSLSACIMMINWS